MSADASRPAALSGRLEQAHRILQDRLRQERGGARPDSVWTLMAPILRPYRWHLIGGIALNAIHGAAIAFQNFLLPILLAVVVDVSLPLEPEQRLSRLLWLMALYLVISVIGRMTFWHLGYRLFTHVRERAMRVLRAAVFRQINRLCLRFHLDRNSGDLFSCLFGTPINQVVQYYQTFAIHLPGAVMVLVVTFAVLCSVDWLLTLILFATVTVSAWLMRVAHHRIHGLYKDYQKAEAVVSGRVADLLRGSRAVKLYAMEHEVDRDFEQQAAQIGQKVYQRDIQGHMQMMRQEGTFYVAFALTTGVAGWKYLSGDLSLAAFSAYPLNFIALQGPLSALFTIVSQRAAADAGMERIGAVLRAESSTPDPEPERALPAPGRGEIVFQNVQFAYAHGGEPVLRGLDLRIPAGQRVALVGPSGAGKSTISQLLLRFYDPDQGQVTAGGTDLRRICGHDLRRNIGVVPQDPFIFRGTVRENVRVTRPDADDAAVWAALRRARLDEVVLAMPQGLDALLGEGGVNLSGGQRQRLAIARVLLFSPGFYIFDEATSALDSESEGLIQATIDTELHGATVLIIAHRLATVKNCDRILVIDQGRIVEDGGFAALVGAGGLFSRLVAGQQLAGTG